MRPLQQESQETPGQEGLTFVILNHTLIVLWQRTAQGTNTGSSPKSIFPTGTISLRLMVLISWPALFHSRDEHAMATTGGRGDAVAQEMLWYRRCCGRGDAVVQGMLCPVPVTWLLCTRVALHEAGFQSSPGEQSLCSWQTGGFSPPLWFSEIVPGACCSPLEPGELWSSLRIHPCNHLGSGSPEISLRLMCYRPGGGWGVVSLFSFKVRLMSWKSMFPH